MVLPAHDELVTMRCVSGWRHWGRSWVQALAGRGGRAGTGRRLAALRPRALLHVLSAGAVEHDAALAAHRDVVPAPDAVVCAVARSLSPRVRVGGWHAPGRAH